MAAEFILSFNDTQWYSKNRDLVDERIRSLPTFVKMSNGEYWLQGLEGRGSPGRWEFDVRLFTREIEIFIEVSSHPKTIELDLISLFSWIREKTQIAIQDEDGEPTDW
ncbi:hypothetical protein [Burkholderia anthina]|uniref:hypothetical protein n=1 Tax=Burkholderia anthina TaxID=179879 RepID=UPI001588D092|nr:hypothetical protein [Burkholderia anthina]